MRFSNFRSFSSHRAMRFKALSASMSSQLCSEMFTRKSKWDRATGNRLKLRVESCIHGMKLQLTSSTRRSSRQWREIYLSENQLKVHVCCSIWEIPSRRIISAPLVRLLEILRQVWKMKFWSLWPLTSFSNTFSSISRRSRSFPERFQQLRLTQRQRCDNGARNFRKHSNCQ